MRSRSIFIGGLLLAVLLPQAGGCKRQNGETGPDASSTQGDEDGYIEIYQWPPLPTLPIKEAVLENRRRLNRVAAIAQARTAREHVGELLEYVLPVVAKPCPDIEAFGEAYADEEASRALITVAGDIQPELWSAFYNAKLRLSAIVILLWLGKIRVADEVINEGSDYEVWLASHFLPCERGHVKPESMRKWYRQVRPRLVFDEKCHRFVEGGKGEGGKGGHSREEKGTFVF